MTTISHTHSYRLKNEGQKRTEDTRWSRLDIVPLPLMPIREWVWYIGCHGNHYYRSAVTKKRKQAIEESKYLGGDIEHTHLVKGLDYALLQKVGVV